MRGQLFYCIDFLEAFHKTDPEHILASTDNRGHKGTKPKEIMILQELDDNTICKVVVSFALTATNQDKEICRLVQSPWLAVGVSLMADWSGGGWEVGATLYLIIRVEDDLRRVERCHKHVARSESRVPGYPQCYCWIDLVFSVWCKVRCQS